ncbi:hypothetical protein GCM10027515_26490 [Schumannella luteola]|uniref:Transcriptional regulator with XRE-family HTH domain n=1 Tax=Schumannella luteola TaxID=472059 RepID=A0A852YE26_9MICO|nr:helix-turn-helix transcriptional regulator [Schumannella luteola]NYG99554.1 transcriptional regulator with XRE-family HTH domain [Schumannella luteola]TPX03870.1 helix-turn-helix transcriptional regulator [Schumannella luteola]
MPTGSAAARLLGERIRIERIRVGVTQMELANLAGLNVANYGRIERGIGNPNLDTLVRVAHVLGVEASTLIAGITAEHLPKKNAPYSAADFVAERGRRRG